MKGFLSSLAGTLVGLLIFSVGVVLLAAGALAAYAARAGMEAHIFMPRDTPRANIIECEQMGAHVTLINGLILGIASLLILFVHQPLLLDHGLRTNNMEGALFLSDKGELLARTEAWVDQRLTQRAILQPRLEVNFAAQDIADQQIAAGVSNLELGLRLRYEIAR